MPMAPSLEAGKVFEGKIPVPAVKGFSLGFREG